MNPAIQILAVMIAGWLNEQQQLAIEYLKEENRVLREHLGDKRIMLNDDQRRRLAVKGKILGRKLLNEICTIVTPDTILRWHRTLIARKYDGSANRKTGKRKVMQRIRELCVLMASENPSWGYTRIRGALSNLGHKVGRSTIHRILKEEGLEPLPKHRNATPPPPKRHTPEITTLGVHSSERTGKQLLQLIFLQLKYGRFVGSRDSMSSS